MDKKTEFSVLMPVYYKDNTQYFKEAVDSVLNQTVPADEILIIQDGKLSPDLDALINSIKEKYPDLINIIKFEENQGIGKVRALGVEKCRHDIIAFMDSDDISRNDRFEKQIKFLDENPEITMVGSFVTEFDGEPQNIYSRRILPTNPEEVHKFAKYRMPVNNNTVMFRRNAVKAVGSYRINSAFEDYELCGRLLYNGYKIANIPDYLVNMRAGAQMMNRRKGLNYFLKFEYACMKSFLDMGFINRWEFLRNIMLKFMLRVIPDRFRNLIYKYFLRK